MTKQNPYVIAVGASVPIVTSIGAIWLLSGGDETCGPRGCNVGDMVSFFGLLLSYAVALPLFIVSLVRCSWRGRISISVLAMLIVVAVAFPLFASLGHNPQGNYCRYLEAGQHGSWLAITMEGDVCEIVWRRWLAVGAPWTWIFWMGGFTIFAIRHLKRMIESGAQT